jgi:hypothetical protein
MNTKQSENISSFFFGAMLSEGLPYLSSKSKQIFFDILNIDYYFLPIK